MEGPIFHLSRVRLTALLKTAYERGCNGWLELAEDTAESLVEQCIIDLNAIQTEKTIPFPDEEFDSMLSANSDGCIS